VSCNRAKLITMCETMRREAQKVISSIHNASRAEDIYLAETDADAVLYRDAFLEDFRQDLRQALRAVQGLQEDFDAVKRVKAELGLEGVDHVEV